KAQGVKTMAKVSLGSTNQSAGEQGALQRIECNILGCCTSCCFGSGRQCISDDIHGRVIMGGRDEPGFIDRRRQVNSGIKHGVEEWTVTERFLSLGIFVVGDTRFGGTKSNGEQRAS